MKLSLEVFPPKISDGVEKIYSCLEGLAALRPDFISVTYSAGNASKGLTREVCVCIQEKYGVKAVSHLTCAGATKESLQDELKKLKDSGIGALLALRGDLVGGKKIFSYPHATDLMREINAFGGFEICGACYPEGHVESGSVYDDFTTLKMKYDLGVRTFLSQLFLDNADFLRMEERAKKNGIDADFAAGIMPVTSATGLIRMVGLSGAKIPNEVKEMIDKFGGDKVAMKQAGIEYAVKQIQGLQKEGCGHIHLYTMDNAVNAKTICDGAGVFEK